MRKIFIGCFFCFILINSCFAQFFSIEKTFYNKKLSSLENELYKEDLNISFQYTDTSLIKNFTLGVRLGFCKPVVNPIDIPEYSVSLGYELKLHKNILVMPYLGIGFSFNLLNKSNISTYHPYFELPRIETENEYNFEEGYFVDYYKVSGPVPNEYLTPEVGVHLLIPIASRFLFSCRSFLTTPLYEKYVENYRFTAGLGDINISYKSPISLVASVGIAYNIVISKVEIR